MTGLEKAVTRLQILDVKINKDELFNLFMKGFKSTTLLEKYLFHLLMKNNLSGGKKVMKGIYNRTVVALSE